MSTLCAVNWGGPFFHPAPVSSARRVGWTSGSDRFFRGPEPANPLCVVPLNYSMKSWILKITSSWILLDSCILLALLDQLVWLISEGVLWRFMALQNNKLNSV